MNTPLCVSTLQVREELGAVGEYSQMGAYMRGWGTEAQQNNAIARRIKDAQAKVENRLGIYFFQTRVVSKPVMPNLVKGVDYDVEADAYPFSRRNFNSVGTVYLRRRPVVSVERAGLRAGGTGGQMFAFAEFPQGWIIPQARLGVMHVMPILGMGSMSGDSFLMLPLLMGVLPQHKTIPALFAIDYTAGFFPREFDPDEDDAGALAQEWGSADLDPLPLLKAVRFMACADALRSLRRVIAPGGGSISTEGITQSWSDGRFNMDVEDYETQAEDILTEFEGNFPLPILTLN